MSASSQSIARKRLIERPPLIAALNGAFDCRLTLIAAHAGAGKTTLLRQWAEAHPDRLFTHLVVESADDDPAHFTRRLVAALALSSPAAARAAAVNPDNNDGLGDALIENLATALADSTETVIVLDDVHHCTNVALVADLGRLIERMPRNVHVVLASRVEPPIGLSRHRVNNDLLELRRTELAFTEYESAALLERISGRTLTLSQVRALRERTEGWAAGLHLAGLHLRHESDVDSFIAGFNGNDRLIADYLGEEVIAGLPPERRQLLLEISALDEMCAGLVEAATGRANAQRILEELERECMFLVPLDAHRQWFRFHHLFSELLRSDLRTENPAEELRILTAAADWHLGKGRVNTALGYLLRAQARDGAMEPMLSNAADAAAKGWVSGSTCRTPACEPLSTAQITQELFARVRHARGDGSAAHPALPSYGQSDEVANAPYLGGDFVAAQVLWRARPDVSTAEASRRLSELTQKGVTANASSQELCDAMVSGGRAHFLAGDTDEARRWLSGALVAAESEVVGRVSALSALSLVEAWSRNTARAVILTRDALETARAAGMLAHPAIADACLASVLTALEPLPPDLASSLGRCGFDPFRDELSLPTPSSFGAAGMRHQSPAVQRQLHSSRTVSASPDDDRNVPTALFERAAASIALGDTEPAREIATAWDQLVQPSTPLSVAQKHILRARLAAVDATPENSFRERTAELRVAELHGPVDVFVLAGPLILQRLSIVPGPRADSSDIVRTRAARNSSLPEGALSEPLTDREHEILEYLPTRLTNVELARRFYVSVNTIKTHMAHIYRKLDTSTRDGAIKRAREFGLL